MHLDVGSDWTGRLSHVAEERALRWADAGVTRIADLLIIHERDGPWQLMTAAEAAECYPDISAAEYQQFVDRALPREWQHTLKTAPERICTNPRSPRPPKPQQGDFISTTLGNVLEITGAPTLVSTGTAQPYQRQGNTARLRPVGPEINVTATRIESFQQVPVREFGSRISRENESS